MTVFEAEIIRKQSKEGQKRNWVVGRDIIKKVI
jgi:hypothetical protein